MTLTAEVALDLGQLSLEVHLQVASDEVVALLGPNGAGKTTLLRVIAGLIPFDRGQVVLDGSVLDDPKRGLHLPTERRPIGVVFQDYLLFPHLSVRDNVAFGLRSRGVRKRKAGGVAEEWLRRVGLDRHLDARPGMLSGGQRQRVALARALAPGPRLLLLDEPLSALDSTVRAEIRRDLKRHLDSFPGTRLMVTHDPLEAVALADRLAVVKDGRLTQVGSAAEVTEPRMGGSLCPRAATAMSGPAGWRGWNGWAIGCESRSRARFRWSPR